jgi:hypothetical protein
VLTLVEGAGGADALVDGAIDKVTALEVRAQVEPPAVTLRKLSPVSPPRNAQHEYPVTLARETRASKRLYPVLQASDGKL